MNGGRRMKKGSISFNPRKILNGNKSSSIKATGEWINYRVIQIQWIGVLLKVHWWALHSQNSSPLERGAEMDHAAVRSSCCLAGILFLSACITCIIRESDYTPPIRLSSSTISPLPGALLLITNTTSPHHSGYNCGARVLFRPMRTEFSTYYDVRENARGTTNSSSAVGLLHHPLLNYYYYYPSINKQSIEWMSLLLVNLFESSLSFSCDLWSYYLLVDDIYVHPFISCPLENVL